jgi:hypothetical protein
LILRAPFGVWGRGIGATTPHVPRLQTHEHSLAFFAALLALALVGEVLVLRPILATDDVPVNGIDVVFGLVGGSFAISGLVAWHRRPDSRTGALMTATGFAFFISPLLRQVDGALAYTVWSLLVDTWIFFFVPVMLTLLTAGRMRSPRDRWLVAAYAFRLVLLQVIWLLFADLEEGDNLLLAFPDEDVANVLDRTQRGLLAAVLAVTVFVIAYRWWRASLANVTKYARATTAAIRVRREDGFLRVEVADDGVGGAHEALGSGLRGLADRVEALDGTLRVTSPAGAGTTVRAELPCES